MCGDGGDPIVPITPAGDDVDTLKCGIVALLMWAKAKKIGQGIPLETSMRVHWTNNTTYPADMPRAAARGPPALPQECRTDAGLKASAETSADMPGYSLGPQLLWPCPPSPVIGKAG